MTLEIPELSLVLLVGASSSRKSTFARAWFRPTEVLSSDAMRGWVSDEETDQDATAAAFEVLHHLVAVRLRRGRLTVVDATNLRPEDRFPLVQLAKEHHALVVAVVFDVSEEVLARRHEARADRSFPAAVLRSQVATFERGLRGLREEGFHRTWVLRGEAECAAASVVRVPLPSNRRELHGPFDIVGDVHGCREELDRLLAKLGWVEVDGRLSHPDGRMLVFLGDLVDRGPDSPGVLRRVMDLVEDGQALCVPGNHDVKMMKKLLGQKVSVSHGLAETLAQLEATDEAFRRRVIAFVDGLVSHLVLDDGRLCVAHAGVKEEYQGRGSAKIRAFCLYGDTTGETDGYGLPVRGDWASTYRGRARVVHGHTPVHRAEWVNRVICVDTGCVFGGRLTALRWPEEELVDVPALKTWYAPVRPLVPTERTRPADALSLDDVSGKRRIETRVGGGVAIHADQAAAALEVVARFAVDPHWLVYLPPTLSPCDAAPEGSPYLEHPEQAFGYYESRGVDRVVLEEKHAGARAVAIVCRAPEVAVARFGASRPRPGVIHTRTGRPFFRREADETAVLARLAGAMERAGLWASLATDWVVLDGELGPGSTEAAALARTHYAPAGAASRHVTARAEALLERTLARDPSVEALLAGTRERRAAAEAFDAAWRRSCGPGTGVDDLRFAPFHLLASEGAVHVERAHDWHLAQLARLAVEPRVVATRHRVVSLSDAASRAGAVAFWEALVASGGEGGVVKPLASVVHDAKGLVQPALKVRGRESLRLIHGPEYTLPHNLSRLRKRSLAKKRSLAVREFALGVEALEAFVERRPLREVHACVFGVLALECEPVDPRP